MFSPRAMRLRLGTVGAILLTGLVIAFTTLVVVCAAADRRQREMETRFLETGITQRIREIESYLNPYLIWDDAIVHIDNKYEPDWIEQNIASVSRNGVNDIVFLLDGSDRVIHTAVGQTRVGLSDFTSFEPTVRVLAARVRAEERRPGRPASSIGVHRSAVVMIGKAPALVTVGLIEPDDDAVTTGARAPLLVTAAPVADVFVKPLQKRYFLNAVDTGRPSAGQSEVLLPGLNAPEVGLIWTPRRPGEDVLRVLLPIMIAFSAVLAGAAWIALKGVSVATQRALDSEENAVTLAREAQAANDAKGAFLSNMSHELRTPLTSIIGFAGLLEKRDAELDEEQRRFVRRIVTGSEALLIVINDVLDYSKLEAQAVELDPTPCRVRDLIQEAVLLLSPQALAKGLELSVSGVDDLPEWALIDAGRLRQVLLNLVSNAVKFTSTGKVLVDVAPSAQHGWRISVIDSGPGISADALPRLFERFSQADSSTTRRFGGTGLGLAISRALIELMGGSIGVDSEEGQGSRFWFDVAMPAVGRPAVPAVQSSDALIGGRILVVDDAEANRDLLSTVLTSMGVDVVTAPDGIAALEIVRGQSFDLILMDVQMPGMDGLDCTRALRASGATLPILALTANVGKEQTEACLQAGMDGHLSKPISLPQLVQALGQWLAANDEPGRTEAA